MTPTPDPAAVEAHRSEAALVDALAEAMRPGSSVKLYSQPMARCALAYLRSLGWRPPAPSTVEPRGCAMPGCCSAISAGWRPPAPEAGREEQAAPSPEALRQAWEAGRDAALAYLKSQHDGLKRLAGPRADEETLLTMKLLRDIGKNIAALLPEATP